MQLSAPISFPAECGLRPGRHGRRPITSAVTHDSLCVTKASALEVALRRTMRVVAVINH